MKLRQVTFRLLIVASVACMVAPTRAEEITLKSGQKVVGTIVGFENGMFRVETEFGVALVRKDKVQSIQVSKPDETHSIAAPSKAEPERTGNKTESVQPGGSSAAIAPQNDAAVNRKPAPLSTPPQLPAAHAASAPAANPQPAKSNDTHPALPTASSPPPHAGNQIPQTPPRSVATQVPATPAANHQPVPEPANSNAPAAPEPKAAPPVSHPIDAPMPAHLLEHVDGNTYFNDTFQFSMYKPPDWKIIEGVPKLTGSGIMAMGTDDQMTLLIVDRQVWSGAPQLTSDQVEAQLRQTYQEYHRLSEEPVECNGQSAIRRSFTGVVDGAEWHGVAVQVIRGNTVFGIIGLTAAESYQFQESVFNKVFRTFRFLSTGAGATSSIRNESKP